MKIIFLIYNRAIQFIFAYYKYKTTKRNHLAFTSTLPSALLKELEIYAHKFKTTKKNLIEKAVTNYLEELKRQEYISSFKYANKDKETLLMAEEGIAEYKKLLEK